MHLGAVGALVNIPSVVSVSSNVSRRYLNGFVLDPIPVVWIADTAYTNLTLRMMAREATGNRLVVSIIEPQNSSISAPK